MTTLATAIVGQLSRSQSRLEKLVDRMIEALFDVEEEEAQVPAPTVVRSIHETRRLLPACSPDLAHPRLSQQGDAAPD